MSNIDNDYDNQLSNLLTNSELEKLSLAASALKVTLPDLLPGVGFSIKEVSDDKSEQIFFRKRTYTVFFAKKPVEFKVDYTLRKESKTEDVRFEIPTNEFKELHEKQFYVYKTFNRFVADRIKNSKYFGVIVFLYKTIEEKTEIKKEDYEKEGIIDMQLGDELESKDGTKQESNMFFDKDWVPDSDPSFFNRVYPIYPQVETSVNHITNHSGTTEIVFRAFCGLRYFHGKSLSFRIKWVDFVNTLSHHHFFNTNQYLKNGDCNTAIQLETINLVNELHKYCYEIIVGARGTLVDMLDDYNKTDLYQEDEESRLQLSKIISAKKTGGIFNVIQQQQNQFQNAANIQKNVNLFIPNDAPIPSAFTTSIPPLEQQMIDLQKHYMGSDPLYNSFFNEQEKKMLDGMQEKKKFTIDNLKKDLFDTFFKGDKTK